MRPHFPWRLRSGSLELGHRTLLMGVVNVTPDSFSDGGLYFDRDRAVAHSLKLLDEGADLLDIGGESTRPGTEVGEHTRVSEEEEAKRVLPVVAAVLQARPQAILSVDTYRSDVARQAVKAGAEIVNDVSAGRWDAHMLSTLAELECGAILMHSRGRPDEWHALPPVHNVVALVQRELQTFALAALQAGVARERVVLDPGFGFGKNLEENYSLLARLGELHALGFPLLAGTSRKGFIGRTLARPDAAGPQDALPAERLHGTLATVTAAILQGAHIVRVHDVAAARDAVKVADAIVAAKT